MLARSRALVAAPRDQEELHRFAIEQLGRTRVAPQLARAHLLYGEWLRRRRRRRDARDHLVVARDLFASMGAEAFARRAAGELRASGGIAPLRPGAAVSQAETLTPQEARIAGLVGDGMSNAEIGALLFVSRRTVEYHLHKVFRKLDVGSRTQLAAALRHREQGRSPAPDPARLRSLAVHLRVMAFVTVTLRGRASSRPQRPLS